MGLPQVNITFKSKALKTIQQGDVGILALLLKDNVEKVTEYSIQLSSDVPESLSDINKDYIQKALLGGPKKVKVVVISDTLESYLEGLNYLETIDFNVLAVPGALDSDMSILSTWVKDMRDKKNRKILAVLKTNADHEGVINFTTEEIETVDDLYTSSQYSSRIAGLIAGLPLTIAPTFQVLKEVISIPKSTKEQTDTKIKNGEFILYHDGEKTKIARGVTSLTTTTENKSEEWKKIKLVRIYDKIYTDIKKTIEDEYVGKVQNSYINKLLLVTAINTYLEVLEQNGILDPGKNKCEIDLVAQKMYLKTKMREEEYESLSEQEIKEANTGDVVFLKLNIKALDAIEDVNIDIFI
ncbi:phage tail sheath protein [Gottschalkia purinilytica]|uniref:Phage tail sheath protein n=2 Tax=Gottschalkia purinilytica TaxID=1503 RepID=A0A0L0W6L5_GOTPU|nr:phage tail sheath protein [Gottschalkia purinilytica]